MTVEGRVTPMFDVSLGIDPEGNLVTGESQGYRVQKFVFKGLTTASR